MNRMKNPAHPGELVAEMIDELARPITEVADALGISRQMLHKLIAAKCAVTPEMAVRLEKVLGSTRETWLRMQMNFDLAHIDEAAIKTRKLAAA